MKHEDFQVCVDRVNDALLLVCPTFTRCEMVPIEPGISLGGLVEAARVHAAELHDQS